MWHAHRLHLYSLAKYGNTFLLLVKTRRLLLRALLPLVGNDKLFIAEELALVFSLFSNHLALARLYWSRLVEEGDWVVDATCGNGLDTLFIARELFSSESGTSSGHLWAIDLQKQAIETTKKRLEEGLEASLVRNISFVEGSHEQPPLELQERGGLKLVVYNLGYLPGGDKTITTQVESTLASLDAFLPLIREGGAITVMCYPGHQEGAAEERALLKWCRTLSTSEWNCCWHQFVNGRRAPSLLLLQKQKR